MNKLTGTCLGMLISLTTLGQTKDTLRLTLIEAINHAVKNNPQLKSTRLDEEANQSVIKEVRSSALPQITGTAGGTDNFQRATQILPGEMLGKPGTSIPVQFGTQFVYSGAVQLNQTLYNPTVMVGLRAAKASQGLYQLQTFKSTEDLVYNIASVYVQMIITEKQKELIQGNLDRMRTLIEITDMQYKEGIIKKVDLDQLKVSNTNLQTQLSNAENEYVKLDNNIKLLLDVDVDQPLLLSSTEENIVPVSLRLNTENNTDLNILNKQIQLQNLNTAQIRSGYLPNVSLVANYNRQWQTNELFNQNETKAFNAGYYGINVSIPIFDGFKKRSQVAQSNIASQQMELNKLYLNKDLHARFKTATNNLNQNQKVSKAQEENMKLAADLYNVAKLSYTEGITDLSQLINAETSLREAQSQYLTATLQTRLSELETMRTSGQLSQLIKERIQ
jgi:outer membrane protein